MAAVRQRLGHRLRDHAVPVRRHARFRGTARRAGAGLYAAGALFSSLSLICLTLLDGPHRTRALDIPAPARAAAAVADRQPGRAGRFAARSGNHERVPGPASRNSRACWPAAALLSARCSLRFRRPITHLIRNQPARARHAPRPAGAAAADRTAVVRAVPAAGGHLAGQHGGGRRRQRQGHAPGPAVRAGGDRGHGRRRRHPPRLCARRPRRQPAHGLPGQLRYFGCHPALHRQPAAVRGNRPARAGHVAGRPDGGRRFAIRRAPASSAPCWWPG